MHISPAGDSIYLVPEEAAREAPPSYASAQLDAVPPYWETTIHAPSAPDAFGEMIIDALPTGSLFSFLWNMLISISFQYVFPCLISSRPLIQSDPLHRFVGFLLTYLLHTTHAARFGSRAGLGVTLIQYGFALRAHDDSSGPFSWWGGYDSTQNQGQSDDGNNGMMMHHNFPTKEEAEEYYRGLNITMVDGQPTATTPGATMDDMNYVNDVTTDWLSFFLMTIGMLPPHSVVLTRRRLIPFRLVHSPQLPPRFLARQALRTQHPRLAAAERPAGRRGPAHDRI